MGIPETLLGMLDPELVENLKKFESAWFVPSYIEKSKGEMSITFHKKFEPSELEGFSDKFKVHLTKNYRLVFKSSSFDIIISYDYFGDSNLDYSIAEYSKSYLDIKTIKNVNEILEKELLPCEEDCERTY